jgi:hypothetical protein
MKSLILSEEASSVGHKSEQHANLALYVDLAIDVSGVGLYCAGLYAQHAGYLAVP